MQSMRKFLIVIVNVVIIAAILSFVVLYSGYESEDYYRHEISAHEQGMRAYFGDDIGEMTIHQKLIEQADKAHKLIDSIYGVLKQNVLSEMESIHFTALANNRNYRIVFSFN